MQETKLTKQILLGVVLTLICNLSVEAQLTRTEITPPSIDIIEARKIIEGIDRQFSEDFKNADSVAIAAHYATDGTFGSIKGKELVTVWGGMIRSARESGTPHLDFTTNSLFSDGGLLVELGTYESKDKDKNVKATGKYLIVWIMENGEWKIYRDIGL